MTQKSLQTKISKPDADIVVLLESDKKYQELISNINEALSEAEVVAVETVEDLQKASFYVKNFKEISKTAEVVRKELVKPLTDKKTKIDSFFKKIPQMYEDVQERLESDILALKKKLEKEAEEKAEQQRKLDEERFLQDAINEEELRKKELEEGFIDEVGDVLADVEVVVASHVAPAVRLATLTQGAVSTRRVRKFRVISPDLVPREFLTVDMQKLQAERMKHDFDAVSTVAGVEFYVDESIV